MLIAMGIMTVGLLGVASVFPVGGWQMQKAEIADRGAAIAQSVMSDLIARGMLNPGAWYEMTPSPNPSGSPLTASPNYQFSAIDGKYTPQRKVIAGTFTRPFAETLNAGLKLGNDPTIVSRQFGNAFVIDPMFAAAAAQPANGTSNAAAYPFPATAYAKYPWPSSAYYGNSAWDPWRAANKNEKSWPIRRVTFQMTNGWPMDQPMAESLCRVNDDLMYDFPERADRPAIQKWDLDPNTQLPMARQWTGDYSWLATVVPTTTAARDAMARNPEGFAYDVSVVVFYKRSLPSTPPTDVQATMDAAAHERMVRTQIVSTGPSGGELLLSDMQDVFDASGKSLSPFDQLKVGQWMMLCGPHPQSNATFQNGTWKGEPRFFLNWYQVIAVDKEGTGIPGGFDPTTQRLVTVRGPEWPWQPADLTDKSNKYLSNDLCGGIFRGAVAVHSKTIRLESQFSPTIQNYTPPGVSSGSWR
ncbi:MAG: hypothetical protein U0805_17815 [Pirellulales bacterium]